MPYIVIEEGEEPQLIKQLKEIAEIYKVDKDNLYHQFSRKKLKSFEVGKIKIYKR
jgi:hypothetical protein